MKPVELKFNLEQEIYFSINVLFVLSNIKKENPNEYYIIQRFVERLKKEREKIG